MTKLIYFLVIVFLVSCKIKHNVLSENVEIEVYTYELEGKLQASAMPKLASKSKLNKYGRRFEYLLINVSDIHSSLKAERRKEIWDLYPDTVKLKSLYLDEFNQDEKLENYFKITSSAINNKGFEPKITFTSNELMEVASKFFYCDKVFPDTNIQSHVCVGLNGISEAKWNKDFKLLEAICYEAIFDDFDKDTSSIDEVYSLEKKEACQMFKTKISTLDLYLLDVRGELFKRMANNLTLKTKLIEYYKRNQYNLAFKIEM